MAVLGPGEYVEKKTRALLSLYICFLKITFICLFYILILKMFISYLMCLSVLHGTAVIGGVNCHVGVGNQSSVLYSQY